MNFDIRVVEARSVPVGRRDPFEYVVRHDSIGGKYVLSGLVATQTDGERDQEGQGSYDQDRSAIGNPRTEPSPKSSSPGQLLKDPCPEGKVEMRGGPNRPEVGERFLKALYVTHLGLARRARLQVLVEVPFYGLVQIAVQVIGHPLMAVFARHVYVLFEVP